jgi:hypothetical protein
MLSTRNNEKTMRADCINAVSQAIGRQITQAEAAKIEQRITDSQKQLWKTDRRTMMGLTKDQQFRLAASEAAKSIKIEAAKKQQRVALTILAHDNIKTFLENQPGRMGDNLRELLAGKKTMSVESSTETNRHNILAELDAVAEPFLPSKIGFDQGNTKMEAVYRELHGQDTGDAPAKAYAKKLTEAFESQRQRFNEAGGKVGHLDDWSHPQAHSSYLAFKAGKDGWINAIAPKLERSRYVNEDGSGFSDQQFNDFLGKAWESIAYEGQLNGEIGANKGTGMAANAHSQSRQLHFKDADSYLEYHKQFGEKSLHATLISHIDSMSKDIAMIERLGPNPSHQFNWWNDYAYREDTKLGVSPDKLNANKVKNDNLFKEVAGIHEAVGNRSFSRWMDAIRSINLIALGSSGISTITDLNTMNLTAQYNHISRSKMMVEHLRALSSADSRRAARRLGIGLDAFAGAVLRHGQEQITNGIAAKMGGAVIRLSGMPFITEANRQAFSITMMDAVAHVVDTHADLAAIDKTDARMMFTHGIDQADFAIWKQAVPEVWVDGESKLLTVNSILAVPGADPKALRKSADKFMALVLDEQNMAVSQPGASERALMNAGTARGTVMGELARSFWQFKSFGLSYLNANLKRAMSIESPQSAAAYAATFLAQGLIYGAIATQLKEIVNGRDPLAMGNASFAGRALLASGGLGLFGDFLNANNSQYGSSLVASMAGPTISKAEQLYDLTVGNIHKAGQGEKTHVGAEALRLANSVNPLGTVWFTKSAFNHLVLQNLQESLSPGYLRRTTQRAQREFGQSYYWKPGQAIPDRGPDVSKAFTEGKQSHGKSITEKAVDAVRNLGG